MTEVIPLGRARSRATTRCHPGRAGATGGRQQVYGRWPTPATRWRRMLEAEGNVVVSVSEATEIRQRNG
jgi:hypothetical protein